MRTFPRSISAALALLGLAGAAVADAAPAPPRPLTEAHAYALDESAFIAVERAVIYVQSDSAFRFPTGRSLVAQIDKYGPSLSRIITGARVGTGGHIGAGASTTKQLVFVSKLSNGRTLTVSIGHDHVAQVHES